MADNPARGRPGSGPNAAEDPLGMGIRGEGAAPTGEMLARALAHVEAALAHARKDEWEHVAALDGQCRALVDVLTSDAGERDPAELADGLSRIRERYRELLALAEVHRDQLAESVRSSVHGRAGARAYEENR